MWDYWEQRQKDPLKELLDRKEQELEFLASWRFGPKQRALYQKLCEGHDAVRRELELRKLNNK